MVERGQVLERMTTIQGPQGTLEALWQGGGVSDVHGLPVVVCPPHPRLGGSMDSPVAAELVWTLGLRRHPTTRFNYAGVGASEGAVALPALPASSPLSSSDWAPLVEDAAAVIAHVLASTGERQCCVVGVSVGCFVAALLGATHDAVAKVALVSPPLVVGPIDGAALDQSGSPWSAYVGSDDAFCPVAEAQKLQRRTIVIEGANHSYSRGLPTLARAVAEAFE